MNGSRSQGKPSATEKTEVKGIPPVRTTIPTSELVACHPYACPYLLGFERSGLQVFDCSNLVKGDSISPQKFILNDSKDIVAVGYLPSGGLVAISQDPAATPLNEELARDTPIRSMVKIWSKNSLESKDSEKKVEEFAVDLFNCVGVPISRIKLHVLPDEKNMIMVRDGSTKLARINLAEKKSEIVKAPFPILDSAYVSPNYLAIIGGKYPERSDEPGNKVLIVDPALPKFLEKPLFTCTAPNTVGIHVWPTGNVIALLCQVPMFENNTLERWLPNITIRLCDFKWDSLRQFDFTTQCKPGSVISGNNLCFIRIGSNNIETFDVIKKVVGRTLQAEGEDVTQLLSTSSGLCAHFHDNTHPTDSLVIFPSTVVLSEKDLQSAEQRLRQLISDTTQMPLPVGGIVTQYVGPAKLGFFQPEPTLMHPQPNAKVVAIRAELEDLINQFSVEDKFEKVNDQSKPNKKKMYHGELLHLLASIDTGILKDNLSLMDCVKQCPVLDKLIGSNPTGFTERASKVFQSKEEDKIAAFIDKIKQVAEELKPPKKKTLISYRNIQGGSSE